MQLLEPNLYHRTKSTQFFTLDWVHSEEDACDVGKTSVGTYAVRSKFNRT